ncbi:MAG TPA: AtpZ/AtpI family protein [Thermomicrobiales bacterium]|nr:AtpZ/AtpI family protein [Thermomicrobiales bacterium]
MADDPTPERRAQLGSIGLATGLGCSIVVTLILTIGGGVLIDRWRGTEPIFTFVGLALGLVAAGYELWELANFGNPRRNSALSRRLGAGQARRREGTDRFDARSREDEE